MAELVNYGSFVIYLEWLSSEIGKFLNGMDYSLGKDSQGTSSILTIASFIVILRSQLSSRDWYIIGM